MKSKKRTIWLAVGLFMCIMCNRETLAQEDDTVFDKNDSVKAFERMLYPQIARQARIEGVVVVRVKLDATGRVVFTKASSGPKLLIADALSNVQKWRFNPNAGEVAVVIYEFRLSKEKCETPKSRFAFRKPNIATVVSCVGVWQP